MTTVKDGGNVKCAFCNRYLIRVPCSATITELYTNERLVAFRLDGEAKTWRTWLGERTVHAGKSSVGTPPTNLEFLTKVPRWLVRRGRRAPVVLGARLVGQKRRVFRAAAAGRKVRQIGLEPIQVPRNAAARWRRNDAAARGSGNRKRDDSLNHPYLSVCCVVLCIYVYAVCVGTSTRRKSQREREEEKREREKEKKRGVGPKEREEKLTFPFFFFLFAKR
jgi:hypothetical protein